MMILGEASALGVFGNETGKTKVQEGPRRPMIR
jgi:hypothetical protein